MKTLIFILAAQLLSITGFSQPIALTQKEKDAIQYMREEEKLARDVYDSLYSKWGGNPFGNIRQSEQTHMDKMNELLTIYKLEDPVIESGNKAGVFKNSLMQKYYNELVTSGSQSLTDALKAGAKIEELDISDLEERIKQTQKQDIISTYNYLNMASKNHLRAFVRRLKMQGINYEPVLLDKESFNKIIADQGSRGRKQ